MNLSNVACLIYVIILINNGRQKENKFLIKILKLFSENTFNLYIIWVKTWSNFKNLLVCFDQSFYQLICHFLQLFLIYQQRLIFKRLIRHYYVGWAFDDSYRIIFFPFFSNFVDVQLHGIKISGILLDETFEVCPLFDDVVIFSLASLMILGDEFIELLI